MSPTKWIVTLFAACLALVPVSVYLGRIAAQDQDAAGKVLYFMITTMILLCISALALGIPALSLAKRHKEQVHVCARVAAWLIFLSPALIASAVIGAELVGDVFR